MRFQRASGLPVVEDPDAPVFMRPDGDPAVHIKRFLELGFDADQLLSIVRVLAEGLSHAAEVMRYTAVATTLRPGATELEIGEGLARIGQCRRAAAGPDDPGHADAAVAACDGDRVHQRQRAGRRAPLPGARLVAVAFADLVGFTRLGEEVPPEELERLANRLAEAAREVAVKPVRFIKTIGDAVMLVSAEAAPLLEAMLALVETIDSRRGPPQLRAGVSFGAAVSRAGDWFGSPVNLASRVTGVARPASVLVTEAARDQIGDDDRFSWSFAKARHLKGIKDDVKLFRARRAENPDRQRLRRTATPPAITAAINSTIAQPAPASHHTAATAISAGEASSSTIAGCCRTTSGRPGPAAGRVLCLPCGHYPQPPGRSRCSLVANTSTGLCNNVSM